MKLTARFAEGEPHSVEVRTPGPDAVVVVDGEVIQVHIDRLGDERCLLRIDGRVIDAVVKRGPADQYSVMVGGVVHELELSDSAAGHASGGAGPGQARQIKAQMPGRVVRWILAEGAAVEKGSAVLILEAMKMQNEVRALRAGKIARVLVAEGQRVATGEVLFELE